MHLAVRLGALALLVATLAGCQQAPNSIIGPSSTMAAPGAGYSVPPPPGPPSGSPVPVGIKENEPVLSSGGVQQGFKCTFDTLANPDPSNPANITTDSHLTIAASGNRRLVCFGQAEGTFVPGVQNIVTTGGWLCAIGPNHAKETTTDWQLVIAASGHITLTCKSN